MHGNSIEKTWKKVGIITNGLSGCTDNQRRLDPIKKRPTWCPFSVNFYPRVDPIKSYRCRALLPSRRREMLTPGNWLTDNEGNDVRKITAPHSIQGHWSVIVRIYITDNWLLLYKYSRSSPPANCTSTYATQIFVCTEKIFFLLHKVGNP